MNGEPAPDCPSARASVVIPAHNEARVVGRLLCSLATQDCAGELEVLVVANGCSDDTAEVAAGYAGRLPLLHVVELPTAGKRNALQTGDEIAAAFPRIFVDADIEFTAGAVDSLIRDLDVDRALVGAPQIRFDDSDAGAPVRAFYRIFRSLPYARTGLVGLGVYGLSARGRDRFVAFPELTADDLFVQRLFADEERVVSAGAFVVKTPTSLGALLRVRTRVAAGNRQLARLSATGDVPADGASTTQSTVRSLVELVRREPSRLPDALVYVGVTFAARARARRFDASVWHRDETSR